MRSTGLGFRALQTLLLLVALVSIAKCDASPMASADPDAPDPEPAEPIEQIRVVGPRVVVLESGTTVSPQVAGYNRFGGLVEPDLQVEFRSSERLPLLQADPGSLTAPDTIGASWITARWNGLSDSIAVWVQPAEPGPSQVSISLIFAEDVPEFWRVLLRDAADFWQSVILAPLPVALPSSLPDVCGLPAAVLEGPEHGVRIQVRVSNDFPQGTYVEAVGGPCVHRGLPLPTTVVGEVTINADRYDQGSSATSRFRYVARHEIGHALGLVGVIQGHQPPWVDQQSRSYRGVFGLFGHSLDTGDTEASIRFNGGAHWEGLSLMGSDPSMFLAQRSVGALMDLGYPAVWPKSAVLR